MPIIIAPRKALNKAYLKVKPVRNEIELFKSNLIKLLEQVNHAESEEFNKNVLADFLKNTFYSPNYFINTKGRNDLVIHNNKTASDSVGVIIEAKRSTNVGEMIKADNINNKALQELVLYYLRERITHKNLEVKNLIVTNVNEWFIFDANVFEKYFAQNKKLVQQFNDFEAGTLSGIKTDFFYKEVASVAIEAVKEHIEYTYFNIAEIETALRNSDKGDDTKLIPFYKLLSPQHLLKIPFANDSNSLNKSFYSELLHIIGLEETKDGGKKLIGRKKIGERYSGTLIENAIIQIESESLLSNIPNRKQYGSDKDEQLFNVAIELAITWINRILFLKLLEAQLITYHKNDNSYAFLNTERIKDFDELNTLFFQVLASKVNDRSDDVKTKFAKVPYLNSSLFERSEIEGYTLRISNLNDSRKIPILSSTVLKNEQGKRQTGELNAIEYLFEFLNAYDFASDGNADIQEDSKSLINASVLGLIFEKINGYKDGSFFTPGFVTMYMSREALRKSVVQKFNENMGLDCKDLRDIYNSNIDANEANAIINSIKICDPAVGSGHFLVSALNEIIAIKAELEVLQDKDGKRLKNYSIEVVNDELIVSDEDGELFEYNPSNPASQRIQETLFNEKQTIIESCLFGVDINPNSVKICRLRLWIELLKNAYYKADGELETLPNIDINIKCGNSLISRFDLNTDLKEALKKSKLTIAQYKSAVQSYRAAKSKDEKWEMDRLINEVKTGFRTEILYYDPKLRNLEKLRAEVKMLELPQTLFEESAKEKKERAGKRKKALEKLSKLESEVSEIRSNKIYENAFEWRFEFPEVLNDAGDYIGFDTLIGNPPYIDSETMVNYGLERERNYISSNYLYAKGNWDIYIAFFERGLNLIKHNGNLIYITPDKWITKPFGIAFREQCLSNFISITKVGRDVFDSALVDSILTVLSKKSTDILTVNNFDRLSVNVINSIDKCKLTPPYTFDFLMSDKLNYINKIELNDSKLQDLLVCENACATSDAYKLKEFVSEFDATNDSISNYYKVVNTGSLDKYVFKWETKEMVYLKDKYKCAVVKKSDFSSAFKNSYYTKSNIPKIIVKGLTKLDAGIDLHGNVIAGKSTLILTSTDLFNLKFSAGILNSILAIRYIKEKYSSASYNGGIVFTKDMINTLPINLSNNFITNKIVDLVDVILAKKNTDLLANVDAEQLLIDMYVFHLYNFEYSDFNEIVDDILFSEQEYNSLNCNS